MGVYQNGFSMQDPERKISYQKRNQVVTEFNKICFVCKKKKVHHTRQEALKCNSEWDEAIKVE